MGDRYDSDGKYMGRIDDNGDIYDKDGIYQGRIDDSGDLYDNRGVYSGRIDDSGDMYNNRGVYSGKIDESGDVRDNRGAYSGRISSWGDSDEKEEASSYSSPSTDYASTYSEPSHSETAGRTYSGIGGYGGDVNLFGVVMFLLLGSVLIAGMHLGLNFLVCKTMQIVGFAEKYWLYVLLGGAGFTLLSLVLARASDGFSTILRIVGFASLLISISYYVLYHLGGVFFWAVAPDFIYREMYHEGLMTALSGIPIAEMLFAKWTAFLQSSRNLILTDSFRGLINSVPIISALITARFAKLPAAILRVLAAIGIILLGLFMLLLAPIVCFMLPLIPGIIVCVLCMKLTELIWRR